MATPDEMRTAIPEFAHLDDQQLVDALHQTFYPSQSRDSVAARIGVKAPVAPPAPTSLARRVGDAGLSLLKGAVDIPEVAVGLADIPTGGRVGKFLANEDGAIGFRPAEAKAFLDNGYSEAQKRSFQAVGDARGFGDTAAAVATHPSVIVQGALESAPSMIAGGAVSRAALLARPAMSAALAGAIGEGTVAAGQQVEQTREETPGGVLTPEQVALTAGSGLIDAVLSFGGSKLAHAAGATNVATWLTGKSEAVPGVSKLRQVLAGGGEEGLQEFLQSAQEQVLQNKAEGKPLDEGVDQAAILGLTTGAAMGAGANLMHSAAHAPADAPVAPPAPGDSIRATSPPVSGPTSRAAAVAVESTAEQVDAGVPPPAPASPVPVLPDVDPAHVQGVLDHANTRSAQLAEAESGSKEHVVKADTPEGADTIIPAVPGRHLTPDEKTEQEFLNEHGGDAQAVAAHYTNLIPNLQRQMTVSATHVASPEELAAVQPDTAMRAGDQGAGTGVPFTTRGAANLALSRHEAPAAHSVVAVDGGHVIRPNEAPVPLPPAADETPTVTAPDGSQRASFPDQAAANRYLKQARKQQGVIGTGVKPVQLPEGHWVLATREEQAHIAALASHISDTAAPVADTPAPAPTVLTLEGAGSKGAIRILSDGTKQRLMVAPDGGHYWGHYAEAINHEGGHVIEGADRDGTPATFATSKEAREAGNTANAAPKPAPAEWKAFPPESGTLGIPRSEMPQVAAEHRGALVNFLKARGVTAEPAAEMDSRDLKATQAEFSPAKVQRAQKHTGGQRSILVSSDGHVVDGHHQAIAAQGPISVIRLNAPIRELIPMVHDFPSATRDGVAKPPAAPEPVEMRNGEVVGHGGFTPTEAREHSIWGNGREFAHTVREESATEDFDPKEVPEGVLHWPWPSGMTDAEKHAQALKAIQEGPQFRRKQGVLAELRKAAAGDVPKPAEKRARAEKTAAPAPKPTSTTVYEGKGGNVIDEEALQRRNLTESLSTAAREQLGEHANMLEEANRRDAEASFDKDGKFTGKAYRVVPKRSGGAIYMFDSLDEAKAHADSYGQKTTPPAAPRKRLGKTAEGRTLFEGADGKRSYTDSGFKYEGDKSDPSFQTIAERAAATEGEEAPDAPVLNDLSHPTQHGTEEQAKAAGFTMRAYRGVDADHPFNDTGTTWLTTSRSVAEAYASEVMGYDNPSVIEVMVNPKDLPRHDASRLSDEERGGLQADDFGNPQAVGIYDRSDDHPLGGSAGNVTVIHAPKSAVFLLDAPVAHDRTRVGTPAVMDKLAAQGYQRTDAPKVRVAERLNKLMEQINSGEITEAVFVDAVDRLARETATASNTKQANRMTGERERGPDIVREKIIAAMRRGEIDRETGEFAQWLINNHAQVTEGLGIGVRTPGVNGGSAGQYNPASRIMTLFKGATNDGTAVHEILHHTERMMPARIQDGIHREWSRRIARAIAAAKPGSPRAIALGAILEAVANPSQARQQAVNDAFHRGDLDYDQDYQLVNPSEFWAVNATEILQRQYHGQTWMARAKAWLSGMVQAVKSILRQDSDHAVLRGIEAVLNGDGSEQSRRMLSERATHDANQPDADAGRRGAIKALAGGAAMAAGVRGLTLTAGGDSPSDAALVKALGPQAAASASPGPASAASSVLHDLTRPTLDAVRAVRLPMGYTLADFMGAVSGKINVWHKTIGTPYHLAQKFPEFKRVFDGIQSFLNDVSYHAADAADLAPTMLPKLEGWRDLGKSPISVADTQALDPALNSDFDWTRDADGTARQLTDDERQAGARHEAAVAAATARNSARAATHLNDTTEQKRDFLLRGNHVTPEVMRMWEGRPKDEHAKMVDTAFQKALADPMPAKPEGVTPGVVFSDDELRQHFKMTDRQIGLYRETRAAIDRSLDHVVTSQMLRVAGADVTPEVRAAAQAAKNAAKAAELIGAHLEEQATASPERADTLRSTAESTKALADRIEDLKAHGYMPRSRFGTLALDVVGKDGERQYFQLFETAADRKRVMRQLKESGQFAGSTFTQGTTSQEKYKLFSQMSPDTVELFGDMIGLSATGDNASDLAFQEFLKRAKANTSAMKHLMHRTGVEGFSRDAGRVLAGFVYSNARLTSNGLHAGEIQKAVNDIPQGMGQLTDAAYKLMSYVQNPQEEGARLKGLLFAQYLGGSVASALVNATQPFMTTLPYLSQHGGLADAGKHMAEAAKLAARGGKTGDAGLDAAMEKYSDAIQPQEVHQMMAQAQGRAALHAGDGTRAGNSLANAHNAMSKIGMAWGKVFGVAESFNRRLTFIAAYNQAVAHGVADPGAAAGKAVAETQFIMNKGNKPQWARGAVGSVLFTFKQYSISYLEMMQRMATTGAPGSPERAAGRRAVLYAIGAMMMMAGADGLPFIEDIDDVIDGVLQRLGYNFHSKQARESWLRGMLGEDLGKVVTKGLSGLPGAPLDVSGRLGMSNLIPGTGLLIDKTDHTSDLMEIGGPAADMAKRAGTAAVSLLQGNVGDAATQAAPKALANAIQAAGMWNSGMYKDQSGKKVIDTDFMDGLSKFIGFQPRDVADAQSANFAVTQVVAENRLKQTQIADAMAKAQFAHDADAMAEARADLASWNEKNPDTPIRIKPADIRTRVKNMSMTKQQRTIKASPAGMRSTVRERLAADAT